MRKCMLMLLMMLSFAVLPTQRSHAVVWVVITEAMKKVIKAMDLAVQRLQNKTIWLQNAQKALENTMSKVQLDEITGWVEKQRNLYKQYYDELVSVKTTIAYYHRVRSMVQKQIVMVQAAKKAHVHFGQDTHFRPDEIAYIEQVCQRIVQTGVEQVELAMSALQSLSLKMTDAERLSLLSKAADAIDAQYASLMDFTRQQQWISVQRSKDMKDLQTVKALYGLE